jgi:tetratricopeptide (TPR) repeat protein
MTVTNNPTKTELERSLELYQEALEAIESAAPNISEEQALNVLLARDTIEELLPDKSQLSETEVIALIQLDERLHNQGKAIARSVKLAKLRQPLNPDEDSAWWWFFTSTKQIDPWDRLDWVWNLVTAGALALGGSYMFITLQAFAVGGLGVTEAFSTIAQASGIALLGKGALTSDGHKQVQKWLEKVGIPSKFFSEVTCAGSVLLLLVIYSIHTNLPSILYKKGDDAYNAGRLGEAEERILQAIQLNPENSEFYVPLGQIYETTAEFDKALAQYKNAVADGNAEGFNMMGRVYIQRPNPMTKRPDPDLAETLLRAGLQRVGDDPNTEYQLRRNLGWALLGQKKYAKAEQELKNAIALDSEIPGNQIGGGMAFCFLAQSLTEQGKIAEAEDNWVECLDKARPETASEYRWFMKVGQQQLATCINTSGLTAGIDPEAFQEKLAQTCEREKIIQLIKSAAVEADIVPEITDPAEIKALQDQIYTAVNNNWIAGVPESDATYQLTVNKEGKIFSYKPVDDAGEAFKQNAGLDKLVQSNADGPFTDFTVVFTSDGELTVSPEKKN